MPSGEIRGVKLELTTSTPESPQQGQKWMRQENVSAHLGRKSTVRSADHTQTREEAGSHHVGLGKHPRQKTKQTETIQGYQGRTEHHTTHRARLSLCEVVQPPASPLSCL